MVENIPNIAWTPMMLNRRRRVRVRVRNGRISWRCDYGEADWRLLIARPLAEEGERERECVCVCVCVRLRASRWTMGVTARFIKGVVLEAAGTQTESERRWALFFHTGSRPGSEGYIQDKYAKHDTSLGQKENKRGSDKGNSKVTATRVCCPVASVRCVRHVGRRGNALAPRLQRVLTLQHRQLYSGIDGRVGLEVWGDYC